MTPYLREIYGELPTKDQDKLFRKEIMSHTYIADDLTQLIRSFRFDAHPMSIFIATFAAMSAYAPEANPALQGRDLYTRDHETMDKQIIRILGKATTVAAMAYRIRIGRPFNYPRNDLTYTENMLYMMDVTSFPRNGLKGSISQNLIALSLIPVWQRPWIRFSFSTPTMK
jgi:citrate synthase